MDIRLLNSPHRGTPEAYLANTAFLRAEGAALTSLFEISN
jgi:hypothetical protein